MREIKTARLFRRQYKKLQKSGRREMEKLQEVMRVLAVGQQLTEKYLDHELSGEWKKYRECHIEGDWLLIYKLEKSILTFVASGSHSELFE